jgi:hypothetical protein
MADAYARKGDSTNEFAIYDSVLQELAVQAQNLPLGSSAEGQRFISYSPVAANTAESEAEDGGEEQEAGAPEQNAVPQRRTNPAFQVNTPASPVPQTGARSPEYARVLERYGFEASVFHCITSRPTAIFS